MIDGSSSAVMSHGLFVRPLSLSIPFINLVVKIDKEVKQVLSRTNDRIQILLMFFNESGSVRFALGTRDLVRDGHNSVLHMVTIELTGMSRIMCSTDVKSEPERWTPYAWIANVVEMLGLPF